MSTNDHNVGHITSFYFFFIQRKRSATLSSCTLVFKMHNLKEVRPQQCREREREGELHRCIEHQRIENSTPRRQAPLHSIADRWIKLISLCAVSEWLHTLGRGRGAIAQHVGGAPKGFQSRLERRTKATAQSHRALGQNGGGCVATADRPHTAPRTPGKQTAPSRRSLGGPGAKLLTTR